MYEDDSGGGRSGTAAHQDSQCQATHVTESNGNESAKVRDSIDLEDDAND